MEEPIKYPSQCDNFPGDFTSWLKFNKYEFYGLANITKEPLFTTPYAPNLPMSAANLFEEFKLQRPY